MFFDIKISNSLGNTGFTTPAHLNMARNSKIEEQIYLSTAGKGLTRFDLTVIRSPGGGYPVKI